MVPNTRGFSVSDHRGLGEYLTKVNILLEEGPFTEEDTFYRDIMGMVSHNSPMTVDRRVDGVHFVRAEALDRAFMTTDGAGGSAY